MIPPSLKGFQEHGVEFTRHTPSQSQGICPACGKDKFFANPTNMLWDCKVCITTGNFDHFLKIRMVEYQKNLKGDPLLALSRNRNIKPQTLTAWGVGYDPASQLYMVPMDGNLKRTMKNIHRYTLGKKAISTSKAQLQLMAPKVLKNSKTVWLAEGEWDAMALWEALEGKEDVYASPGAGTFPRGLIYLFQDKDTRLVFDNDMAGKKGSERTGTFFSGIASKVQYLHWPIDADLEDGYDVRKLYTDLKRNGKETVTFLTKHLKDRPPTLAESAAASEGEEADKTDGKGLPHYDVIKKYRQWLHISNPEVLEVLFGAAIANRINIDPLWLFFVGPPGSGKTELLMTLTNAPLISTTTSLTAPALISGSNNGGDPSLIPKLNKRTLIIKDFTTILSMNQTSRDEIFGILRDAYDGKIEKHFGNGVHRNYESKFGILAGVTSVIEGYGGASSVLGERFIRYKFRFAGKVAVGREQIKDALRNLFKKGDLRAGLKEVAKEVLSRSITDKDLPNVSDDIHEQLITIGHFVAVLRGVVSRERYTGNVIFKPSPEVATRLATQFLSLAVGISIYRQEDRITADTMKVIRQVAKDTTPDRVEEIVRQLYILGIHDRNVLFPTAMIAERSRLPSPTVRSLLDDLTMLHVVKRTKEGWRLDYTILSIIEKAGLYASEKHHASEVHRAKG